MKNFISDKKDFVMRAEFNTKPSEATKYDRYISKLIKAK